MCRKTNKYCTSGWFVASLAQPKPALANQNCLARPASSSPVRHSPGALSVKGPHSPAAPSLRTCYPEGDGQALEWAMATKTPACAALPTSPETTNDYKKTLSATTSPHRRWGVGPTTRQDGPFFHLLFTHPGGRLPACMQVACCCMYVCM